MDWVPGLFSSNHCAAAISLTLHLFFLNIHNGLMFNRVEQPTA